MPVDRDETTSLQRARGSPAVRFVLSLWLVFALTLAVKTAVSPTRHTVFPKNAERSLYWWQDQSLYEHVPGFGPFVYSPTHAILLTPFALMGYVVGGILWTWLCVAVYVAGLRRLVRDVMPGPVAEDREAVFLALAMIGAIRGLWNAQGNALIIGLLMLGASALIRGRWWSAAILLSLPVHLKIWPVSMVLLLVAMFPRPMIGRLAIGILAGVLLPFLTRPPGIVIWHYQDWLDYLRTLSHHAFVSYRDLRAVLYHLDMPMSPLASFALQAITGAAVLSWCLLLKRRGVEARTRLMLTLSAGAAWAMIFGGATEYNTMVVLAPSVSWMLMSALETGRGRGLAGVCFLMTMVLGAGVFERAFLKVTRAALLTICVGSSLCLVWLLRHGPAAAGGQPDAPSPPSSATAD